LAGRTAGSASPECAQVSCPCTNPTANVAGNAALQSLSAELIPRCRANVESFKVLVVGIGDGSLPVHLQQSCPARTLHIHVVEQDSRVVAAFSHFLGFAQSEQVHVAQGSLLSAVGKLANTGDRYDAVLVNCFVRGVVPAACRSLTFVRDARRVVAPGGVLMHNFGSSEPPQSLMVGYGAAFGHKSVSRFTSTLHNGRLGEQVEFVKAIVSNATTTTLKGKTSFETKAPAVLPPAPPPVFAPAPAIALPPAPAPVYVMPATEVAPAAHSVAQPPTLSPAVSPALPTAQMPAPLIASIHFPHS